MSASTWSRRPPVRSVPRERTWSRLRISSVERADGVPIATTWSAAPLFCSRAAPARSAVAELEASSNEIGKITGRLASRFSRPWLTSTSASSR